jgi:hypothetical protein
MLAQAAGGEAKNVDGGRLGSGGEQDRAGGGPWAEGPLGSSVTKSVVLGKQRAAFVRGIYRVEDD